jgi:hypothetical protein
MKKAIEVRIHQDDNEIYEKAGRTFKFSLPDISLDTRGEPREDDEEYFNAIYFKIPVK